MMQSSDSRSFPIRPRIYIPKYDPQNIIHVEIADLCKIMHKKYNDAWVVFQPHTYSRTKNLLKDFANSLLNFDHVIVLDIYAAREKNLYGITSKDLVEQLHSIGKEAKYIPDFNECASYIKNNVKENDIVLTLGAGTVTEIGPMLLQ